LKLKGEQPVAVRYFDFAKAQDIVHKKTANLTKGGFLI